MEVKNMAIVRWDPFGEMLRMQRDLDRIFSRVGVTEYAEEGVAWMPKIDGKRSGDEIDVHAEPPGVPPAAIAASYNNGVLEVHVPKALEAAPQHDQDRGFEGIADGARYPADGGPGTCPGRRS